MADEGGYFEFGVFKGYTFWYARTSPENMGSSECSSTASIPLPACRRSAAGTRHRMTSLRGQYACPKEQVVANLNAKGVDWSRTHLVEGYFEHSLNDELKARLRPRRIAIALIDCDLYESTVLVLNFIEDLIVEARFCCSTTGTASMPMASGVSGRRSRTSWNGTASCRRKPCSYGRYGQCSRCGPIAHVQGGGAQLNAPSTGQASWLVSRNYHVLLRELSISCAFSAAR